jgi:hypothetical protein
MPARSEAPHDPRPYIRVALDLPMNPKLAAIEENFHQCGWAYICSLVYCGQSLTDGHFPMRAVLRMADVDRDQVMALVEQGLWHLPDHDCPDCEQPKAGHAIVHDYLQHQRSAAEVHDLSSKRSSAGRKGAQARWSTPKQPKAPKVENGAGIASAMANAIPNAKASAQQELWQNDGKPMAEEKRGEEIDTQTPSGSADRPPPESALAEPGLSMTQRSKIITDAYYEIEPMCKWPAINGVVLHAIKSKKYTDIQILDAMRRLANEGRTVSVETLRVEITGFAPRNNQPRSGQRGYPSWEEPQDQSAYDRPFTGAQQ